MNTITENLIPCPEEKICPGYMGTYTHSADRECSGKWVKVFNQKTEGQVSGMFSNKQDALNKNPNQPNANLYSILDQLENFRNPEGNFHLKLCYPDVTPALTGLGGKKCNEWVQSSNPVTETNITGYQPISIAYNFKGLGPCEHALAVMDSTPGAGNWFFAIGVSAGHHIYGTSFPGPGFTAWNVNLNILTFNGRKKIQVEQSTLYHIFIISDKFEGFQSLNNKKKCNENNLLPSKDQNLPLIDIFLNPKKTKNLNQTEKVMKDLMLANFPLQEIGQNFSSLFNLLWHSSLPCHNTDNIPGSKYLLKKCLLHGQEVDCVKLFKPVPTDIGMCCSFSAKNVLKESEFSKLLLSKQNEEYGDSHSTEIGHTKGLKVYVDQHSNRVTAGSVSSESK